MKKLHKHLYVHTTRTGINIGAVIGDDGVVSIDLPGAPEETRAWKAMIAELTDKPVRAVMLTSFDRLRAECADAMNVPVVMHEAVFAKLYAPAELPALPQGYELIPPPTRPHPSVQELTFSESTTFVLGDHKHPIYVDATYAGGHSPGASFFTVRDSGILFVGEHVAVGQPPSIAHGNFARWAEVLNGLKRNRRVTTIIPGRGAWGDTSIVGETLEYINKTAPSKVKAMIRSKRSRSEVGSLINDVLKLYKLNERTAAKHGIALENVMQQIRSGLERVYDDLMMR
jgi:glyoxylase-like metal-dependent hydrolase (beta-lactamase superfamily II)